MAIRTNDVAALASLLVFGLIGCSGDDPQTGSSAIASTADEQEQPSQSSSREAMSPASTQKGDRARDSIREVSPEVCSDAQIADIIATVNRGEIDVATVAVARGANKEVRAFAQQMIEEHGRALAEGTTLFATLGITPRSNGISQALAHGAKREAEELASLPPREVDLMYARTQVLGHVKALGLLDQLLIPSAENDTLRTELRTARAMVTRHYRRALALEAAVEGACGGEAPAATSAGGKGGDDGPRVDCDTTTENPTTPGREQPGAATNGDAGRGPVCPSGPKLP